MLNSQTCLTIDDLPRIATPGDPQISPNGARIAHTLKTMGVEKNKYFTHIHVVPTKNGADDGNEAIPESCAFTFGETSNTQPRWSPDGRFLAFVSNRGDGKKSQIYRLAMDGGEAEKLTDLPEGELSNIAWSPNGEQIAFLFRAKDADWTKEATEARKKDEKSNPPRLITRLRFRYESVGFLPEERLAIHVVDVRTKQTLPLVEADDRDITDFCWSPDGKSLAYVQNIATAPDMEPNRQAIFVKTFVGAGEEAAEARQLSAPDGPKYHLRWSPDGANIAYLGHDRPEEVWGISNNKPFIVPVTGEGMGRNLGEKYDIHFGSALIGDVTGGGDDLAWSADGAALYVLASERGDVSLCRFDIAGGELTYLTEEDVVTGFTVSRDGKHGVLLTARADDAGDLYYLPDLDDDQSEIIERKTHVNAALFAEKRPLAMRSFGAPVKDKDGARDVPCWAILPPDFEANPTPRATLLYIHGGPHAMYGNVLFHEFQALAGAGYVVLFPNPRGSKGYGEAHTRAIQGNWGEPAQTDCLACVDYAVAQGWADNAKLGVVGGSYGGYLTSWIIGNSDRFAAAAPERGVYNLVSMAGTCDFVWRDDYSYFKSNCTTDTDEYRRNSPLTYADNVRCPTLIIHSEGDLRCPIGQADEYFAALKRAGKTEVAYLRYGGESNHDLSRGGPPDLRLDRLRRILDWFDQHLKHESESETK